ncbi:cytokine receptor-like factor 3 [Scleropages formosus]|uniref:Cytokine receptor-like factor 3 n=1 Tax=Scleropages formosus TaxID=113540 RepID=A0A8C9R526_SCLFO|nr:cytokine receptor-like factor 3 [Scleropages formosus]
MSIEVEALLQEAKENIEAAQNYRAELQQRLHGLNQARKQVRGSATQTREALRRHFQDLEAGVLRLLNERLGALLDEVDAIEQDSVRPLDDCQKLIEHGVSTADELLREGEAAIRCNIGEKDDKLGSFTKKALQIQLDSLPEVPALVDVPCLSAQLDDSLLPSVSERIARHGSIASHPPVQIEELVERPGGVLVRWCKVDEDFTVQDYRLQFRRSNASQYEDAYIGKDSEFLVLHLDPHTDHLFRVCARGDGRSEWSPWSVPQTGYTTLAPHEWCPGSDGYILSSRRNMAMRNDSSTCGVLYSSAPTYFCGQTLTFKILAAGQVDKRDSLGVCVEYTSSAESLQKEKAVCISTNGAVFVNGKEMTNQLPAISVGSAVTFDMEVVSMFPVTNNINDAGNFKLRVTIGSGNREVVFDWLLDQAVDCLFFGCSFVHPGWKVLVF